MAWLRNRCTPTAAVALRRCGGIAAAAHQPPWFLLGVDAYPLTVVQMNCHNSLTPFPGSAPDCSSPAQSGQGFSAHGSAARRPKPVPIPFLKCGCWPCSLKPEPQNLNPESLKLAQHKPRTLAILTETPQVRASPHTPQRSPHSPHKLAIVRQRLRDWEYGPPLSNEARPSPSIGLVWWRLQEAMWNQLRHINQQQQSCMAPLSTI
jgi:hypothetical protein